MMAMKAEANKDMAGKGVKIKDDECLLKYKGPKGITILSEPAIVFRRGELSTVPKAIAERLMKLRPDQFEAA